MNAYIYILKFNKSGKYYVGSTSNLDRKLSQHSHGHTQSTKLLGEFQLVFKQQVARLKIARSAERKIKSWKRRDFIERIIQDNRMTFLDKKQE